MATCPTCRGPMLTEWPHHHGIPVVDDGFGMVAEGCEDDRCDIQIVRPGKVQCSNYCGRES